MTKSFFYPLLSVCFIWGLFAEATQAQQAPLYLNIGSHNETTDPNQYASNLVQYNLVRNVARQIADTVITLNARWNMQVESNFIRGVLQYENGHSSSTDFLEWADLTAQIEVDPHNHFNALLNPYNYTDLAKLLDSCGLHERHNMGGFIWRNFPNANEDWTAYQQAVPGFSFPDFSWHPRVIWGGGSPGHIDDYNALGIWKPSGPTPALFGQHNPNNYLSCIGNGCSWLLRNSTPADSIVQLVEEMINWIGSQPGSSDRFYTATLMFNFRDLALSAVNYPNGTHPQRIGAIIRALQPYVDDGRLVWATLSQKYDTWHALHPDPNDYALLRCDDIISDVPTSAEVRPASKIYPNPATRELTIQRPGAFRVLVSDMQGRLCLTGNATDELKLDLWMPPGFYQVSVLTEDSAVAQKLVIH